jgi:glycosyltransferase involved in cell wall biosynthesis
MEKPLISFILTYYNLPVEMLIECIESILALSLQADEREIIVVDDGSKIRCVNELTKYDDEITYIRQRNMGLSEARNTGIQMATGEYLQFVDADDQLIKTGYDACIGIARELHPEMVLFDFTKTKTQTSAFQHSPLQSGSHYMRHHNLHGTACGYLFQRAILGELRFTAGIFHEDEEFTPLLLLRAETVCATNAQAYYYRQRDNSIITKNDIRYRIKKLNDLKGVINKLRDVADHRPVDDRTALQRRVAQLTMDYLYQVIPQTNSRHYLNRKIAELRQGGLFPLPDQNYTTKYTWFRRLSNSSTGLSVLMRIIPLMNKER